MVAVAAGSAMSGIRVKVFSTVPYCGQRSVNAVSEATACSPAGISAGLKVQRMYGGRSAAAGITVESVGL